MKSVNKSNQVSHSSFAKHWDGKLDIPVILILMIKKSY